MKLIIKVQSGSAAGQQRELVSGSLVVGREPGCGIQFDPTTDTLVSKRHALFLSEPDGFYVKDLNSTNGTFVNGFRVTKIRLQNGDTVQFGGQNAPRVIVNIEQSNVPKTVQAIDVPAGNRQINIPISRNPIQNHATSPRPPAAPRVDQNNYQSNQNWSGEQSTKYAKQSSGSQFGDSIANRVLYNPEHTPTKLHPKKYIGAAIVVVIGVLLALFIMSLTILELSSADGLIVGVIVAVIATVVAFLPALFYVLPLLWLDRYDPEPPLVLALAFAWGALVAVAFSLVVNTIMAFALGSTIAAIVSAPIFEEASKGLAIILLLVFLRREFDGIVDGIVYAGVVALGFATVENVSYYGRQIVAAGSIGLIFLFILRGILSPFAHVIFTSMTGIGCGISRETHNKFLRILAPLLGYCAAVMLHSIWNSMASTQFFIIGYFIFEVPFFLIFVGFAAYIMRRENKILQQTLVIEVAKNVITKEQMALATSIFKSLRWSFAGISMGKFWARRRFLRSVAKVGLAWWHIQRAQAGGGGTMSFQQLPALEKEVIRWREQI